MSNRSEGLKEVDHELVWRKTVRKSLFLVGFALFIIGAVLSFYSSQRNCLIAFVRTGYMSFWTSMEILGGIIALAGIIIGLVGFVRKT